MYKTKETEQIVEVNEDIPLKAVPGIIPEIADLFQAKGIVTVSQIITASDEELADRIFSAPPERRIFARCLISSICSIGPDGLTGVMKSMITVTFFLGHGIPFSDFPMIIMKSSTSMLRQCGNAMFSCTTVGSASSLVSRAV